MVLNSLRGERDLFLASGGVGYVMALSFMNDLL